jgi:uncharacterized protein YndB with AHSA1/START domain
VATLVWQRLIPAPPEVVWEVLTNHVGYADMLPVRRVWLEREGDPAPNGLGAIRALATVGPPLREEVIGWEPPRRFAYRLLSGAPVRDHVGTVELEPAGDGTRMTYRVETTPALPVGKALVVAVMRIVVGRLVRAIEREAPRRAGTR